MRLCEVRPDTLVRNVGRSLLLVALGACAHPIPPAVCSPPPAQSTKLDDTFRQRPGWADATSFGAGGGKCPGGDDAMCIQAAINSLEHGGTLYLPPGEYVTKSPIEFADTTKMGVDGVHPSRPLILQGAGRENSVIRFVGTTPGSSAISIHSNNYFSVRDVSVHFARDGFAAKCIDIVDSVYFDVTNVDCWSRPGTLDNHLVGIAVRSTKRMVPPPGSGRISNFIYDAADGSAKPGSRGILLDGSGGVQILFMVIDGWGDIEAAEVGIELKGVANTTVEGSYLIGGGDNGLKFTSASYNNFLGQTRIAYTTGKACNHGTGVGCSVWVDKDSFDNVIEHPCFFEPNNSAVLDQGVRTVWLTTGDGTQPTEFPGRVRAGGLSTGGLTIADGATITGHLSGMTEWKPGPLLGHTSTSITFSLQGASPGDTVVVGFSGASPANSLLLSGQVTAPNVVTATVFNAASAPCAPGLGKVRVDVWKHM